MQLYQAVVDTWYREADTTSFAFYQKYLDHFTRRAAIRLDPPCEHHRRLQLLHHLQAQPTPIPDEYLANPPQGTRPYIKVVAQTSRLLQVEIPPLSFLQSLKLLALVLGIGGGLSNLLGATQLAAVGVTGMLVLGSALLQVHREPWVLDTCGLYHGGSLGHRFVRWRNIYRYDGQDRTWSRLHTADGMVLSVRVPRDDQAWLHATIHALMKRHQTP